MLLTSAPHFLAMWLRICSENYYSFSTPALKELGKGWSWFIILIVKMRCTCADKMFLVPLDHHQQLFSGHKSSLLSTSISILDGLNYLVWKNQMRAWLRSKGLWQITNGNEKKFQEVTDTAPSAVHEANYKQCMDWDNKDNQAYGMILL